MRIVLFSSWGLTHESVCLELALECYISFSLFSSIWLEGEWRNTSSVVAAGGDGVARVDVVEQLREPSARGGVVLERFVERAVAQRVR